VVGGGGGPVVGKPNLANLNNDGYIYTVFCYRWGLGGKDFATMIKWKCETNEVIEINEEKLSQYLNMDMGKDVYQVKYFYN
jgi:hypothetical protein